MKLAPAEVLSVFLEQNQKQRVGRLALKGGRIIFEYDPVFILKGPPSKADVKRPDLIIEEVRSAISQFKKFADAAGVPKKMRDQVANEFSKTKL
jgi:hypothetical protein